MEPLSYKIFLPKISVKEFGLELYKLIKKTNMTKSITLRFNPPLFNPTINIEKYDNVQGFIKMKFKGIPLKRKKLVIGFANKFLDWEFTTKRNFAFYTGYRDKYRGREYYLDDTKKIQKVIELVLDKIKKEIVMGEL